MKIELHRGEIHEEIPCPELAFLVGLKLLHGHGYLNVCNDCEFMKSLLDADGYETAERCFEDGIKLQLAIYISADPEVCSIVQKYADLKLFELQAGDIRVTAAL